MKIIYKRGDLLQCEEKCILHGCNSQGKMASGVAKAIRAKYPSAYTAYIASKSLGGMNLGVLTFAPQEDGKLIINGITQEFYGRDGRQYVDYEAVREVIKGVNWMAEQYNIPAVAMPKIGAGLGGGDWDIISRIIEEESINFQPVIYEL